MKACKKCGAPREVGQRCAPCTKETVQKWIAKVSELAKSVKDKFCPACQITKPTEEFGKVKNSKDGRYSICLKCRYLRDKKRIEENPEIKERHRAATKKSRIKHAARIAAQSKWYRENTPGRKEKEKDQRFQKQYGITLAEVARITEVQKNACAICGGRVKLVVDHNHATGVFRSMLCDPCNLIIGVAHENSALLVKCADYLRCENGQ